MHRLHYVVVMNDLGNEIFYTINQTWLLQLNTILWYLIFVKFLYI